MKRISQFTLVVAVGTSIILKSLAAAPSASPAKPDREMKKVLDELAVLNPKPLPTLSPAEARQQPSPADAVKALLQKEGKSTEPQAVAKVVNRTIDGAGGPIPIRIYTPAGSGPFPVIVYYHGGGWVIADLDTYDSSPRALANAASAIVVSSHYRQGQEHKFPAAHEDALTAYQWALASAKSLGGDPRRVAVAGESAGGNLAAAVCIMARERKIPMPVHQLLVYPIADYGFDTASYQENASARPLNKPMMQWFFQQYLNNPAEGQNPLVSLVNADLKGLPAATVITAGIDPLRSEGKTLADKLRQAGVPVTYKNFDGVTHEFFGMGAVLDQAKDAVKLAATGLKSSFSQSPLTPTGRESQNEREIK